MLRKKKLDFATGARTLRGGKNHYTAKTLCGNWVEGQTDPSYKALAEKTKYDKNWESIAKVDMKDGVKVQVSRYGEGLNAYVKYPEHWLDYGDERYYPKNWQGVTASQFTGTEYKTEFASSTVSKPNSFTSNKKYSDDYRVRWTSEGEHLVDRRFSTTNGSGMNYHAEEFQVKQIRPLKGAPNAVGKLSENIVKHGGPMSWQKIRKACLAESRSGSLDMNQLESALVAYFGVLIPVSGRPTRPEDVMGLVLGEFRGIWAYMDSIGSGSVDVDSFIANLQGNMNSTRRECVSNVFDALSGSGPIVSNAVIMDRYRGKNLAEWQEMLAGASGIKAAGFQGFYRGVSSAINDDNIFIAFVVDDWLLPNQRILPPFVELKNVRVVHKDGRVTTEEIEWDPAMRTNTHAMKTDLLARGMSVDSVTLL